MRFSAGLVLDARERLALVLFSEDAVAVSLGRFEQIPKDEHLQPLIDEVRWIMVKRQSGPRFFLMEAEEEMAPISDLTTPRARESGQLALALAFKFWPSWVSTTTECPPKPPVLIRLYSDESIPSA